MSNLFDYNLFNFLFFIVCIFISYLIITDDRFTFNRKILFFVLLCILFIISIYINKEPYQIIQELFWYSLILNGSFIFHTLILDRMFYYCFKNQYDYAGFLISRISFTFSLSFIIYYLNKINIWLYNNYYNSYNLKYIFLYIIDLIFMLLKIILLNFSIFYHKYNILLLKKQEFLNINQIVFALTWFIILLIISIILGYPRLYIIWLLKALIEFYNIINRTYLWDYKEFNLLNFIDKINYSYKNFNNTYYLKTYYNHRFYNELINIYEKPYHEYFMIGLKKFLCDPYIDNYNDNNFIEPLVYNINQWLILLSKKIKI
jgi:hypothetical protein